MTILSVYHSSSPDLPNKVLTHQDDIAATLAEHGVRFAHRAHGLKVRPGTAQDEVFDICRGLLDQLMTEHGCAAFTALNRDGVDPTQVDLRDEHLHAVDEIFVVIGGRAQVTLSSADQVLAVLCEQGDVLEIAAETRRWIDLGDRPFCLALRLFRDERGVEPRFTGDQAALQFPGMDEL